jgi:hypothetical protein
VTGAPLADLGSFDRIEIVRGGSATGEDLNHSQEEVLSRLYFGGELPEDLHELAYTMPPAAPGQSLDTVMLPVRRRRRCSLDDFFQ